MIFVTAVWIVGVGLSFKLGRRLLPLCVLGLGCLTLYFAFTPAYGQGSPYLGITALAILAAFIWIVNQFDLR